MRYNDRHMRNQDGFASLVIAIILVLVLSLTAVGFAQLAQKETRSALDRQLSSQAFYAAETGVNDAAKAVNAGFAVGKAGCAPYTTSNLPSVTPHDPNSNAAAHTYLMDNHVGPSNSNSKYTCLTIDPAPYSLEYGDIGTDQSKITEISGFAPDGTTPTTINTIVISWQSTEPSPAFPAACTGPMNTCFKPSDQWVTASPVRSLTGVVRVGLTPLYSGAINRIDLANNTYTGFMYPGASGSVGSSGASDFAGNIGQGSGAIVDGACNNGNNSGMTPRSCNVQITSLASQSYMLNLRGIYNASLVTVKAYSGASTQLRIKNGQTLIDSTGIAEDVLRRVQVRIPNRNNYVHPDYDLDTTGNLCKQLQLLPQNVSPPLGPNKSNCSP